MLTVEETLKNVEVRPAIQSTNTKLIYLIKNKLLTLSDDSITLHANVKCSPSNEQSWV